MSDSPSLLVPALLSVGLSVVAGLLAFALYTTVRGTLGVLLAGLGFAVAFSLVQLLTTNALVQRWLATLDSEE
ncbi:hypothetical protein [Halarchaeum sp. P4]|uniref:hypothetical protein n=1 Tax=Halarchaeum sp. P4 TaxID=3421639 RepID=UPI003EC063CB